MIQSFIPSTVHSRTTCTRVRPMQSDRSSVKKLTKLLAAVAFCAAGLWPIAVAAQTTSVACSDTSVLPNPIYLAGSSAFEPILSQLALRIAANHGITVVYSPISSCSAVNDIADNTQVLTGTAHYYIQDSRSSNAITKSCTLASNTKPLIGVSDVGYDTCTAASLPATIGDWHGHVQAFVIVVPEANVTTTAISAEQAAAIWGCGAKGNQVPFIDETAIQQRSPTSGAQVIIARNTGVPESAFKGKSNASATSLVTSLLAVADPQTAIGFIGADAYATLRSSLNAVAFRTFGQAKAYYADSDSVSVNKRSVRNGHYGLQGPMHFMTALIGGQPTATAKQMIDWLTGTQPIDPSDVNNTAYITTVASLGDVPQCAMKVQLDKDGGRFSSFVPATSCNCFFEKAVTQASSAPAACTACTSDANCNGGKRCQTGYCE